MRLLVRLSGTALIQEDLRMKQYSQVSPHQAQSAIHILSPVPGAQPLQVRCNSPIKRLRLQKELTKEQMKEFLSSKGELQVLNFTTLMF